MGLCIFINLDLHYLGKK